mmetsp:Transcript_15611/g.35869  ORF Transcript_15611/g.35869 Transcript_15611/m.35869 type:complete len:213 (-) Transcript_15611:158-796(-)
MLCGVFILLINQASLNTCVDQECSKEEVHPMAHVEQPLANHKEEQTERNRADNAIEERLVLQVIGRAVDVEDHVEHEEVVHGEHPLQYVSAAPIESRGWAKHHPHVHIEHGSTANPKHDVQTGALKAKNFVLPMQDQVINGEQRRETCEEEEPAAIHVGAPCDIIIVWPAMFVPVILFLHRSFAKDIFIDGLLAATRRAIEEQAQGAVSAVP